MGAFGLNRRFASCACGHPPAAHLNGGCFCGCTRLRPAHSEPASPTTPLAPTRRPKHRSGNADPLPPPPLEQFLAYVQFHLTESEMSQLYRRLAAHKSRALPPRDKPVPMHALRAILARDFEEGEIVRFLSAMRARKAEGRSLLDGRKFV
jgi:hypothetical protein